MQIGRRLSNVDGATFYVDFDRIRTNGGYVYYWELRDYLEPSMSGYLSAKVTIKVIVICLDIKI